MRMKRRTNFYCCSHQALISCPQAGPPVEQCRSQQVRVCVTDPHAEYRMVINYCHDLCMGRDRRFALSRQESKHDIPFPQAAKRQFADNKRVAEQPVIMDDLL